MTLNVGSRLGHDDVTALIGEGGYGAGVASYRYQAEPGVAARVCVPLPASRGTTDTQSDHGEPKSAHPILTIEPSLDETELDASPSCQVGRTFRRAPRVEAKVPVEQRLEFTDEPRRTNHRSTAEEEEACQSQAREDVIEARP